MKIAANGVRIYVEDEGTGDLPLVFLHYWGGSSRTWRNVIAALGQSHRTVAIDHRGWGQSDAPPSGYGLADLAADAQGVIDALGLERYILVGHSMGGKVAQLIASRRPEGLAGLVLVAPSPPSPMSMPAAARDRMANAYASREAVETTIDQVLTAKPLSPHDRAQVIDDSLRGAPPAKTAWPRLTSLEDITKQVSAIDVPTIVIAGEMDRVDTVTTLQAELMPRIPQAVLNVLPGTGHLSMLESPELLARIISDFADSLSDGAATTAA
jgi:pimeloyl-ACP methyl ester carboxylesterase